MTSPEETPFLVYYDPATDLRFEWDAQTPTISVSNGAAIKVEGTVGIRNATIARWMQWFELVCHNYTRLLGEVT